jgi:hypothetical protein
MRAFTRELYQDAKQPGSEADPSPPSSGKVKKMFIYTTTPPHIFMA